MIGDVDFKKLIQAVTYYLSYQDKIGKSFMIDESSLKYPVAEYLSSLKISLSRIIAGKQDEFIQHFRSIVTTKPASSLNKGHKILPSPKGFYTEWFDFKLGAQKEFIVNGQQSDTYKNIYRNFLLEYKPRNDKEKLVLPETLITRCIAISALSVDYPTPYVGGVWEIG